MKKTKIVATIGPRTEDPKILASLVTLGMNVARLNMSHGDHEEHGARVKNIRAVAAKLNRPVGILLDLAGPKIRTGEYETPTIEIVAGARLVLTTEKTVGTAKRIYVNYPKLPQEVRKGSVIMLDDGKKRLEVVSASGTEVVTKVIVGGELKGRRGVNVPGANLSIATITAKDRKDIAFGLAKGVDMIALSFVRRAKDVEELKGILAKAGRADLPVIVKIETQEAIDALDDILEAADGVMVARGDLAIEVPTELVPIYQKEIIARANLLGKPVITATQMLESMIKSPVPTRAEVSDIANAIFDGTDAVMLSEESTLGDYPEEAVAMMAKVAETSEQALSADPSEEVGIADTVTRAVDEAARAIGATAIVAYTETGASALMVARFRPACPVIALTPHQATVQKLTLAAGVFPYRMAHAKSFDAGLRTIPAFLKERGLAKKGDRIVVVAGLTVGVKGKTNTLVVLTV